VKVYEVVKPTNILGARITVLPDKRARLEVTTFSGKRQHIVSSLGAAKQVVEHRYMSDATWRKTK
jgi:hypothetical protein